MVAARRAKVTALPTVHCLCTVAAAVKRGYFLIVYVACRTYVDLFPASIQL